MKIPFSPPYINAGVRRHVAEALDSGWITTGPKVLALEQAFNQHTGLAHSIAVNSWTSGAILVLRWLGLQPGDEVIVPAYTYSATALAVMHAGGTPVMVDVRSDFNIDPAAVAKAMTPRTKAIMAVDIGGLPADYAALWKVLEHPQVAARFQATNDVQRKLGRPLLVADAAHSFGATFPQPWADIVIFSLHAVKNLTSAEGGIISLNLPKPFDGEELYPLFKRLALNGQTKDALAKSKAGAWQYDIVEFGMKCNMADLNAAVALGQLEDWSDMCQRRKAIFDAYTRHFGAFEWAQLPPEVGTDTTTSAHLFLLRVRGITEAQRNAILESMAPTGVAVNVHFIPMPLLTLFKGMGYDMGNYPVAYDNYSREISLPIYPQLTPEQVAHVCTTVTQAIESVIHA
jgi:dTDP-4-amino-4,6-dideoxygalactose transaminase